MTPPDHLSEAAAAAFVEATRDMSPALITYIGIPLLETYANAIARERLAQGRIDAEGIIVPSPKGDPVPHPALAIERAAAADIRAISRQLKELEASFRFGD